MLACLLYDCLKLKLNHNIEFHKVIVALKAAYLNLF